MDTIQQILDHNAKQAAQYNSPAAIAARRQYRAEHPTLLAVGQCMDGRVGISRQSGTPDGIIETYCNIGGKLDMGWHGLQQHLGQRLRHATDEGRHGLVIASYHYAEGDPERGCRGHGYNKLLAHTCATNIADQARTVFGSDGRVDAIVLGIETDGQGFVFHGDEWESGVAMSDHLDADDRALRTLIATLYPSMNDRIVEDLLPFMRGNIAHLRALAASPMPPGSLDHTERVLAIGDGLDWLLSKHNFALTIGDHDPRMDDTIAAAAGIIGENAEHGRIVREDAVLFACAGYDDETSTRFMAAHRARYLAKLGQDSIRDHESAPDGMFQTLIGIVDERTRRLEIIEP